MPRGLSALLCALGCSSSASPVVGTLIDTFVTDTGAVEVLSEHAGEGVVSVLVPQADGSVRELPARGDGPGRFVIADVPDGEHIVRYGDTLFVFTAARTIDLGWTGWVGPICRRRRASPRR